MASFTTYFCFQNLTPLYPVVAHDLAMNAGSLGALVGVASLISVLFQLPLGLGSDRLGRRPFMIGGLLLLVVSQLLRARAEGPLEFGLAQAVAGVSLAATGLGTFAAVADAYPVGRGRAIGIMATSLNLGQVAGYILSGAIGSEVGWRTISLLTAILPALVVAAVVLMPEPPLAPRPAAAGQELRSAVAYLAKPSVLGYALAGGLVLAVGQGAAYLLPFALHDRGLGPQATSVLLIPYVVGSVIGAPVSGTLAERLGYRPLVIGWALVGAAVCLAYPFLHASTVATVVAYVLIGASVNSLLSMIAAQVVAASGRVGEVGTATALAGLRIGQSLGPALGPAIAGQVFVRAGLLGGFAALGSSMLVGLAVHPGRRRPPG